MEMITADEFDRLVEFFDRMAQTSWLVAVHDQLKEASGSWEGKDVLDVGCATGRILLRGADEAASITGVDLSPAMVQRAATIFSELQKKGTFQVADAYDLPFANDTFDLAISTCVLFLLPDPEIGTREMFRVVKDGGTVMMLNPSTKMNPKAADQYCQTYQIKDFEEKAFKQWSKISTSRHRYQEKELTDFLKKLGAKSVSHTPVLEGLALVTIAEK